MMSKLTAHSDRTAIRKRCHHVILSHFLYSLLPERISVLNSRKTYLTRMEVEGEWRKSLCRIGEVSAMRAVHVPGSSGRTTSTVYVYCGKAVPFMLLSQVSPSPNL